MKSLFVRGCAAMSLVAAFMFFGCSDDSSPVVSDGESVALSSSDAEEVESSSFAKLDEKAASSSSKNVSSSSAEEELSSSSKKEKKSSSSFVEDETNSSSSLENSSSSELVIVVPDSEGSIIVLSNELVGDGLLTNSRLAGDDMRFKGRFSLDMTQDSSGNNVNIQFTSIEYTVVDTENRNVAVNIVYNNVTPTQNDIDLNSINSAGVKVNMKDAGFTACGNYRFMVTVTATDGANNFQATVLIPFEREAAEYCRYAHSSSSVAQTKEIPMTTCEVIVSTNLNPGLDFASCTAFPAPATTADIIFSKAGTRDNPEITATSGNGTQFAPISNGDLLPSDDDYEVNMWPEDMNPDRVPATAYVSDFKYKALGATLSDMIENSNQIYVAATTAYNKDTGAGFYAFAITDPRQGNNGDYTLTLKVYKVE